MTDQERIDGLLRHINLVRENCHIIADKLFSNGDPEFARKLIHLGQIHDASKFIGIEWQFLTPGNITNRAGLKYAVDHHDLTNPHHVQYWGTIDKVPELYIAEMVCDLKARSSEFGTDLRKYIEDVLLKKLKINKDSLIYKKINEYVDILCPKPFEPLNEPESIDISNHPTPPGQPT